ncbi:DUF2779 domain-containing protein [Flagellimonas sediminis]|uniref:DUF2779 domain-containing protein n=1 Tax=Flagellimonas sediminis TaxID=2696468 RepID=A0A6I5KN31_9FLAO|nr:DUF2779 domain-containing protein [Allomuricauda sediminis]NDV42066.1 DUF2779 domain-containing protein [Allomuricauda sediminis]
MLLTKTDFIQYLNCPESLWLQKNRPDIYEEYKGEFSLFLEKLIKEGYEVEAFAKLLFENGVDLPEDASPEYTKTALDSENNLFFQASFITEKGVFARVDVLEKLPDGSFHIYEIKSSTSIKTDKKHNHLKDACFQKYVLQECGFKVSNVSIINLNKEYIRQGAIIPKDLLSITNVTNEIDLLYSTVVNEINTATTLITKDIINLTECSCRYKTRSNHCDSFYFFNADIPEYSVYEIGRISEKKVIQLVEEGNTSILDIPSDFELNSKQQTQVESIRQQQPIINTKAIASTFSKLQYPLHFVDYETYASAVPKVNGLSPHKHLVFQVSIHTLNQTGELTHFEWLGDSMELPKDMLNKMQEFTGQQGTYISWNAPFEMSRNKDMIDWLPEFTGYLMYMNEHMFDLMNLFKEDYVDYHFHGSTSIKKVLPVLCPQFSYADLEVQDGTMALDTWGRIVNDPNFVGDIEKTRKNLLAYCKLDTLAMVEIYKFLKEL